MTTDLVGFVAATFMRGLPLVLIPTTVLAQADAAIGGKTGVNLATGKNLIGSFYFPRFVLIDPNFLKTLPEREFKNGFPEIVKMGMLRSEKEFREVEEAGEKGTLHLQQNEVITSLLAKAVRGKIAIVQSDPTEKGERMLLNLGHTFAHAIEAATAYKTYSHGEAVSIGLLGACYLSEEVVKFSHSNTVRLEKLLEMLKLPLRYSGVSPELLFSCMMGDKKSDTQGLRLVLPLEIGKATVKENVPQKLILDVLSRLKE